MTIPGLAHALAPYLGKGEPASTAQVVEAGAAGAILKGLFGGNR